MFAGETPQEYFRIMLLTVVSGAFDAAGYLLEDRPTQQAGGLFRFAKTFEDGPMQGMNGFIEYQMLHYAENQPARFRVMLTRTDQDAPGGVNLRSPGDKAARRTLSELVVRDFGVAILPSADHWWPYSNTTELGRALGEAGHLVVGYGMPWLSGDLVPPERE